VIVYDARGHGASGVPAAPEAYSEEALLAELHGLLRHLGIARACVAPVEGLTRTDRLAGAGTGTGTPAPRGGSVRLPG
jgi:hypothetical protein